MKLPCPACEVNQGDVTRLLWRADTPIGWTCRSCKGRYRLASPWQTGGIAVLFGLLLIGSFVLRDAWLPRIGPVWGLATTLLSGGAAIWLAHEIVLLPSKRRLVTVEEAPATAQVYVVAWILGMSVMFAILYGFIIWNWAIFTA